MNMAKKKVLFLCTHNSARSQMAEGLLRLLYGHDFEAHSAGTHPSSLNPYVQKAMAEIGIDTTSHRSKSVNEYNQSTFDYIVTVCDQAKESCPFFPGGREYLHKSFDDPSSFVGTDEEIMAGVRRIRDEIRDWIKNTFS
jgi:arsenate reductase (thioredoxin)